MKRKCYESSWLELEETRRDQILENLQKDTEKFHSLITNNNALSPTISTNDYFCNIVRNASRDERIAFFDFNRSNGFIFAFMAYQFSKDDEIKKAAFDLLNEIFSNHYQIMYYFLPKSKNHNGREIYEAYHLLRSIDWINALKSHGFTEDIDFEHASPFALTVVMDLCYYYNNHKILEAVPMEDRSLIYVLSDAINTVIGKHRVIMTRTEQFMFPKYIDRNIKDGEILDSYFNHGEIDESKRYVTVRNDGIYEAMMIWLVNQEDIKEFIQIRQNILTKFNDYMCHADQVESIIEE